ncbi:ribose ABC transporter substrate-binding protein RbsB [Aureibacillus halotolerans]|uniref:Ribose transport system substrate-binding protein n=1 Tax=Aureibacillus halotolerans TaxID=1508390 RepID=A0A4R6TP33_9BACI|nr:ribose ABC transporter substrate-binding protein RbsB [Aureibacillus halotolerans]TDQ32166.1 ribose transport system substrate-binding protein [Aureibacillus halotolerans]
MKKLLILFLMAIIMVGCSTQAPGSNASESTSEGDSSSEGTDEAKKIGLSLSTLNNPFFVNLKEGAEKSALASNIELITVNAQDDPAQQISGIEDLIQQDIDVLLVNPTDSKAISTALISANEAGIPVITVDRSAEGGEIVAHIASDNTEGGKLAGEFIIEKLGGTGSIVELQGIPGASATNERGAGFHQAVEAAEGVEVVAQQSANFNRAEGLTVMENIIQSQGDFNAVFAHNDEMALGAIQALSAAGMLEDVIVVGFDGTEDAGQAIKEGTLAATVAQQPDVIGKTSVETALKVINGEEVEEFIPVELLLITE